MIASLRFVSSSFSLSLLSINESDGLPFALTSCGGGGRESSSIVKHALSLLCVCIRVAGTTGLSMDWLYCLVAYYYVPACLATLPLYVFCLPCLMPSRVIDRPATKTKSRHLERRIRPWSLPFWDVQWQQVCQHSPPMQDTIWRKAIRLRMASTPIATIIISSNARRSRIRPEMIWQTDQCSHRQIPTCRVDQNCRSPTVRCYAILIDTGRVKRKMWSPTMPVWLLACLLAVISLISRCWRRHHRQHNHFRRQSLALIPICLSPSVDNE